MPTWLAIAIPSVVAVATVLAWGIEYGKKAHEIEKLRLELEKLRREKGEAESDAARRASGLYTPRAEEVDDIVRSHRKVLDVRPGWDRAYPPGFPSRAGCAPAGSDLAWVVVLVVVALYAITRFVIDLINLFRWLF